MIRFLIFFAIGKSHDFQAIDYYKAENENSKKSLPKIRR